MLEEAYLRVFREIAAFDAECRGLISELKTALYALAEIDDLNSNLVIKENKSGKPISVD